MSPVEAIVQSAKGIDLSARWSFSTTVVASPAAAAETIIGSVTVPGDAYVAAGVIVWGWCSFTVGTSGTTAQLRVRQTNVSGTIIGDSAATNAAAGTVNVRDVIDVDTAPVGAQVYKLTLQIANGAATSTVSAVFIAAVVI